MSTPSSPKKRRRSKDQDECKTQPPKPEKVYTVLTALYDNDNTGSSNTAFNIRGVYRSRRDALVRAVSDNRGFVEDYEAVQCDCGEFPMHCGCRDKLTDGSLSKEEAAKLKRALEPSDERMKLCCPSDEAVAAMTINELEESLNAQGCALTMREQEDMTTCPYQVAAVFGTCMQ